MGNYKIAAFDAPLQSVQAHALNLNSHPAYTHFRTLRARSRKAGRPYTGLDAAATLDKYSERGAAYVQSLQSIIKYNKLQGPDAARFADMHAMVLVPADHIGKNLPQPPPSAPQATCRAYTSSAPSGVEKAPPPR